MIYRFDVLNDKDFEELSQALLEPELNVSLQSFKNGRDGGIDLRYCGNKENQIVIQAKHYLKSKFSDLKRVLIKERIKIEKLSPVPQRYILTTTLALNPSETTQILEILSPYLTSTQDIYGADRLEKLLIKHKGVEKRFFKLWITSTNILETILHNAASAKNEFLRSKIIERTSLYVETSNLQEAGVKLNENGFIIITGEPGVGKTTMAYMLICELLAQGYELINIVDKIDGGDNLISQDDEKKQIIFFDDFFGSNLHDLMSRNSESEIIGLISRLSAQKNKLLILTSRTTILNQASSRFEKFNREGYTDMSGFIVEVKNYSKYKKAHILYNHIFHSKLQVKEQLTFFEDKTYLKIVEHNNYFPRLIEFVTNLTQYSRAKTTDFKKFVMDAFTNPSEIWNFAYEEQLEDEERFILCSLFSLGGYNINLKHLESSFEKRYNYEIANNGYYRKSNSFNKSLKKLTGGLIKIVKDLKSKDSFISILNPSIADYLINRIRNDVSEQRRILFSAAYFEQYTKYFDPVLSQKIVLSKNLRKDVYEHFLGNSDKLFSIETKQDLSLKTLYVHLDFFIELVEEKIVLELLKRIEFDLLNDTQLSELKYCLEYLDEFESSKAYVKDNWNYVFIKLLDQCEDGYDISNFLEFMEGYGIERGDWKKSMTFINSLEKTTKSIFESHARDIDLSEREDEIFNSLRKGDEHSALEIIQEIVFDDYNRFLEQCNLDEFRDDFIDDVNFSVRDHFDVIKENFYYEDSEHEPRFHTDPYDSIEDEDRAIHNLFDR